MPITIAEIQRLTHLSNANLKKRECQFCKGEFYSIREAKYCRSACKQSAYRLQLQSEEKMPDEKQNEKVEQPILTVTNNPNLNEKTDIKPQPKIFSHADSIEQLKQQNKLYTQKLKTI